MKRVRIMPHIRYGAVAAVLIALFLMSGILYAEGTMEYGYSSQEYDALSARVEELSQEVETLREAAESAETGELSEEDPYREIGSVPGYNPRAKYYEVPEGFPKIDSRVRFIGNLRGTWSEMGYQYGERAGDLIIHVFDYSLMLFKQRNMSVEKVKEYLYRYLDQIEAYAPEMVEFMEGIAEGAAPMLKQSRYAEDLNDFEKILLVNAYLDMDFFPPRTEAYEANSLPEGDPKIKEELQTGDDSWKLAFREHCTGLALSGSPKGDLPSPTKNGETIIANNCDLARFVPFGWNCAYVATPDDPEANVFWSIHPAGLVGGLNLCTNDKGVTLGNFFGGQSEDDEYDFGVLMGPLQIHTVAYADTAEEAIDIMVFGSEEYRNATGRTKVLQTGLWGYIVADSADVMVLELTPRRHAVRYPGDMGEVGNYVIYANWYGADHYFDEDNIRVEEPIGIHPPEFPERYHTYDWFVKYHFGQLDEELVKEGQKITYYFDEETGRKIEFLEGSTYPLYIGVHTISAYWGAALGMDIGGTAHASQVVQEPNGRKKVNWVQGRPNEWVGPWQSTDFYGYQK